METKIIDFAYNEGFQKGQQLIIQKILSNLSKEAKFYDLIAKYAKGDTDEVANKIIRIALEDIVHIVDEEDYRECTECGEKMLEGYCVNDGLEYFCSDECRDAWYSPEEWQELMEQDCAYWTEWG